VLVNWLMFPATPVKVTVCVKFGLVPVAATVISSSPVIERKAAWTALPAAL